MCAHARACETNFSGGEANLLWSQLGRGLTFIEHLLCASELCQVLCISGSQLGAVLSFRGHLAMSRNICGWHN